MIISASRRCDIPSYFGEWFINRLKEGYVIVPNPFNNERYSKVILTKETIDIIVFWTKNPIPFLKYLNEIDEMGYKYYFQFTITPYEKDIEKNLPDKNLLIKTFIDLSKKIGKNNMVWRYDPILINDKYDLNYHIKSFREMVDKLKGHTERCMISFVDNYKNVSTRMGYNVDYKMTLSNVEKIVNIFSMIAKESGIKLYTCSEEFDLSKYGIEHGSCIDKDIIEKCLNKTIRVQTDKNQRKNCLCLESVEVGTYNCCLNGCGYCYALNDVDKATCNVTTHNPKSPLLIGNLKEDAIITERKTKTIIDNQLSLF